MVTKRTRFPVLIVVTLAVSLVWSGLAGVALAETPKQRPTLTKLPGGRERIDRPDGSSTERWPDGTIIDRRPGGVTVTKPPGGTVISTIPGIGTLTRRPDGTKIVTRADGSSSEREDVVRFFENRLGEPAGTIIEGRPDGTTVITGAGGTATYSRNGKLLSMRWAMDGVTTTYAPDGSLVAISWPDGVREESGPPRRVILPDGTSIPDAKIEKASDGRRVIRFANGSSQDLPPQTQVPGQPKKAPVPAPGSIPVAPIQKSLTPSQPPPGGAVIPRGPATTGLGVSLPTLPQPGGATIRTAPTTGMQKVTPAPTALKQAPAAGQPTPSSIRVAPPIQKSLTPPQQGAQPTKKAPATGVLIGQ